MSKIIKSGATAAGTALLALHLGAHGLPRHWSPRSFARAVLRAEGDRTTRCDISAVVAWEHAEGGNWRNGAAHNPLDTTWRMPGSWPINSDGVQAYVSWRSGLAATIATLNLPAYTRIRAALADGSNAQAVADAVAASPWGTEQFEASC